MSSPEGSSVLLRRPAADLRPRALTIYARKLQSEVAKGRPFECLITNDAELRRLNREFRGKDEPTDVLSFPSDAGLLAVAEALRKATAQAGRPAPRRPAPLGSMAISLQRARAQARAFGHDAETEIRILMLHGALHLVGYDHEIDAGRMARAEKRWRMYFGLPNGLIERVQA